MIIQKIELRNIFTEMVLEILFIVGELLVFGRLFHWFTSLSFLLLVFMGVVIYIISYFSNLLQMKQEAKELNLLIKSRNKKSKTKELEEKTWKKEEPSVLLV